MQTTATGLLGLDTALEDTLLDPSRVVMLEELLSELSPLIHSLGLENSAENPVFGEKERLKEELQAYYERFFEIASELELPQSFEELTEEHCSLGNALEQRIIQAFLSALELEAPSSLPSPLDLSRSLALAALSLAEKHDRAHENKLEKLMEKSKLAEIRLGNIHTQLRELYTSQAEGTPTTKERFAEIYADAAKILEDIAADFPEIREFASLPPLPADFTVDPAKVNTLIQKLELLKMHAQNAVPDITNAIHNHVQMYTLLIDILKNMQKMDADAREAIVRKTGQ